ncbi:hypothetical protein [Pseudaminobacter salicylatoxidans]|uniref:hypothetical protein n=1 Tax=Pseudaminobacter salicylatoxidans TaxID=93369 RepID=UPI0012F6B271|nr:hypothetical protein [Pseudaminobacter salicylatoxidans]
MYRRYANVETNLFPEIADKFQSKGVLDPVDLWAILSWKANRSKTKHRRRMEQIAAAPFLEAAASFSSDISKGATPKDRLRAVMDKWDFRLPTATAILTILYPDEFTVYDYRVCGQIGGFHNLRNQTFSDHLWTQYQAFKLAAIEAAPRGLTLREVDHYHWGKSWHADAIKDIGNASPIS